MVPDFNHKFRSGVNIMALSQTSLREAVDLIRMAWDIILQF